MNHFDEKELLKIAHLSALKLDKEELTVFSHQLKNLINYLDQIKSVAFATNVQTPSLVNVFREDKAQVFESKELLNQAPEQQEEYFVVPKILE
jgi:aspartyl-tRNA(Asn)/glutamyl-tRNA(Gln) amidotransferase subunit C